MGKKWKQWHILDSVLKRRDITLPTKVHIVKPMVLGVIVQLLSHCPTLWDPWTAARQAPLSFTLAQTHVHWVGDAIPRSHPLSSPFLSCPQSYPESGVIPMSWLFPSGSQSTGASASAPVLPLNIRAWFSLGLIGLISLLSKGFSRIFTSSTVWEHNLRALLSFIYNPTLTPIPDYWENHSFDSMNLC